jgi:hypothetical protein
MAKLILLKKVLRFFAILIIVSVIFLWFIIVRGRMDLANYLATLTYLNPSSTSSIEISQEFIPPNSSRNSYDVASFGAKGDGVKNDTTAINNTLLQAHHEGGGTVLIHQGESGNYLINAPLVIYSDTALVIDPGVIITLATSSDSNMLVDAAHFNGDLTVPSPMHNIAVEGGIWARGNNNGLKNNVHSIILGGNNILVQGATFRSSAGKYSVLIQNATHFTVRDLYMDHTDSDGVHVQGPARYGLIQNIKGTPGDDMVSLTPYDWSDYTWGNEGDITDVNIDSIELDNQAIANGVKVLGGTFGKKILKSDRINISNVTGNTTGRFMSAIYLGDDIAQANTMDGQIDNITVRNINVNMGDGTGNALIAIMGASTSLEIPNINISNVSFSSDMSAVVSNSGKVVNLTIDGVRGNTKTDIANGILQNSGIVWAYIKNLTMSNIYLALAAPGGNLISSPESSQGLGDVRLSNIYLYNVADIAGIGTNTNFSLSNINLASNARLMLLGGDAKANIQSSTDIYASSTSSLVPSGATLTAEYNSFPINIVGHDFSVSIDKALHATIESLNLIWSHA